MTTQSNKIIDKEIPDDSVCTSADVMDFLSIKRHALYKWIDEGAIIKPLALPGMKSRSLMWRLGDIRAWATAIGLLK